MGNRSLVRSPALTSLLWAPCHGTQGALCPRALQGTGRRIIKACHYPATRKAFRKPRILHCFSWKSILHLLLGNRNTELGESRAVPGKRGDGRGAVKSTQQMRERREGSEQGSQCANWQSVVSSATHTATGGMLGAEAGATAHTFPWLYSPYHAPLLISRSDQA